MELNVIKKENALRVNLVEADRIYILNEEEIREEFNWCLNIEHKVLVFDFTGIRFVDTTGFRFLLELNQLYRNLGKKLQLVNISEEVEELFELIKVNKLFGLEKLEDVLEYQVA